MSFSRRQLLQSGALGAATISLPGRTTHAASKARPNVLFIATDQHSRRAIGSLGEEAIRTPNVDALIAEGTCFTESYVADPTCCPARAAWWTGRPSCETGVLLNPLDLDEDIPDLGQWLSAYSDYSPFYIGKWHVPNRSLAQSFKLLTAGSIHGQSVDLGSLRALEGFFQGYTSSKPFFTVVSLLNPHDIVNWVWYAFNDDDVDRLGLSASDLPALPPNFHTRHAEAALFTSVIRASDLRNEWSKEKWQLYRWWYHRQVEMMDGIVGRILDMVWNSHLRRDTIVIFTSDHGDMHGEHALVNKQSLYEASAGVPMIVAWPGHWPAGVISSDHLVSGLDVMPTICEIAGIDPPASVRGQSMVPMVEGTRAPRESLQIQSMVEGRAIRTADYKYITYRDDETEQLFNLRDDPWELTDLATDSAHATVLEEHRALQVAHEAELEPTELSLLGYDAAYASR